MEKIFRQFEQPIRRGAPVCSSWDIPMKNIVRSCRVSSIWNMAVGGVGGIKLRSMRLLSIHSPARGRGSKVSSNDMPQQALTYGEDLLK